MTQPRTQMEQERERQRAAAAEFGKNLRRWRRRNEWAQDTAMEWGQAIGCPHVYASQWSQLENGVMRAPSPNLFVNLAWQNDLLARQAYGPITDRALLDRVKGAEAIRHDDGEPWDAADFFAAYLGHQRWPKITDPEPPPINPEQAAEWSATLRAWFQDTAQEAGLDPLAAAVAAMEHADPDHENHRGYQRLILGFDDLTPEQLQDQWRRGEPGPVEWLMAWRRSLGLKGAAPSPPWGAEP